MKALFFLCLSAAVRLLSQSIEVATPVQPGCTAYVWLEFTPDLTASNWTTIAVTRYTFPESNAFAFFRARTEWFTNEVPLRKELSTTNSQPSTN